VSSAHIFLLSGVSSPRIPDGSLVNSVSEIGLSTVSNQHSIGNTHTSGVDGSDIIDANMSMNECGSKVAIASVSDDVMPSESDDVIHDESDDVVFCSVDEWMAQWQMLAVHRPVLVQVLQSLISFLHYPFIMICIILFIIHFIIPHIIPFIVPIILFSFTIPPHSFTYYITYSIKFYPFNYLPVYSCINPTVDPSI
jgi:hypothetical protein